MSSNRQSSAHQDLTAGDEWRLAGSELYRLGEDGLNASADRPMRCPHVGGRQRCYQRRETVRK